MSAIPLKRIEGKYEILEKLGEGGMGAVYKVRHRLLDALRVIKMMRPQLVDDEGLKARFLREARVAIQLRHPNIAQLYDFTIDDDGVASIVMEYIEGLTLERVIASGGRPSLGLALEIAGQSLEALGYLHDKGFIHRDISPDNLMLTTAPDGGPQVKLIDLGIAKTLDGGMTGYRTQSGTFLGKVRYAPPEQFDAEGAAAMDARGDLYAFGVVLYELLTGRYPIQGRDPSSLIAGHLFFPPLDFAESDPDGRVPPALRQAVLTALSKKSQDRFGSAHELLAVLAPFRAAGKGDPGELARIFSRATAGTPRGETHDPGSTQNRLDLQFGFQVTPSPIRLVEAEEPPQSRELAALVERFEAKVRQGDFRGAERLLLDAEVDFPGEEFASLHDRLAEERQRDRAAKAEAQRRAERIATAIADAEERLARGEPRRAGELLEDTVSIFGDDTLSGELKSRIGELRREVRNAERTALLAAARRSFEAGNLEEALEKVRQLERLDPESPATHALREEIEAEERRRQEEIRKQAEREMEAAARREDARRRLAGGDLDGAREELAAALALAPGGEEARALRQEIEAEERRQLAEARQKALAASVAAIAARLDGADFAAAESALAAARSAFGDEEALSTLELRLDEERRRTEREGEAAARVASARRHLRTGDFEAAWEELGAAEALQPDLAPLAELKRQLEEEQRRLEEEARREAERAETLAAIDALLEKGDLPGAAALLPRAVSALGDDPLLRQRSQRIEELSRRAEVTRQEGERAAAVAAIDRCLERSELEEAARLLPAAVARFGGTPALRERWERLETLRRGAAAAALLARAEALFDAGDLDRAERTLRQVLDLDPGNREAEACLLRVRERR